MPILIKSAWLIAIYVDVLVLVIPTWVVIKGKMPPHSKKVAALQMTGLLLLIILAGLGLAWVSRDLVYHLLPLSPLLTRGALILTFRGPMRDRVNEQAKQRAENRTLATGLMAITFAGLVALTIVNAQLGTILFLPVYYMLISFLGLLVVFNIQSYKEYEWISMLADAFMDLAILSMLLSIIGIFLSSKQPAQQAQQAQQAFYTYLFAGLALGVWLIDHLARLYIEWNILYGMAKPKAKTAALAVHR